MKKIVTKLFLVAFIPLAIFAAGCGNQEDKKTTTAPDKPQTQQKQEAKTNPTFKVGNETIELAERSILEGKITLLVPKNFEPMPEEMTALKYPSTNRPTFILTNKNGDINIAFNHTKNKMSNAQVKEVKDTMVHMMKNAQPSAQWLDEDIKSMNNKNIGVLEFISPAIDTKIYNKMLLFELDGTALLMSFNCTEAQMNDWKPIGSAILDSIKTK